MRCKARSTSFLYNTMENIRATALMQDAEDIAMLRNLISHVPLQYFQSGRNSHNKRRIKNVNNYLLIHYTVSGKINYYEEIEDSGVRPVFLY